MSCGIVDVHEGNIRSEILMEDVPWKSIDEVRVERLEHDGNTYYVIALYPEGRDGPSQVHSVWRSLNAPQTFIAMNSPPQPPAGGHMQRTS